MNESSQAEIQLYQTMVDDMTVSMERLREDRNAKADAANSLMIELEKTKAEVSHLKSIIDRLRLHIQQGVEL